MSDSVAAIILAAGKGTRMKSELPKGLHAVGGVPMVGHVGSALRAAGADPVIVVVGHGGELLQEALGQDYQYAWQREQLGTGHAAKMASPLLKDHHGPVIIAPGDAPLVTPELFQRLLKAHRDGQGLCTVASTRLEDPTGYGRIVRDGEHVARIVEHKDATEEERAIQEVAVSIFCFDAQALLAALEEIKPNNAAGEYYLTDAVEIIRAQGGIIAGCLIPESEWVMGVNDRWQLAAAETALRTRILRRHAHAGVTILDPATTYIGAEVEIAPDTVIEPNTFLAGRTRLLGPCHVGPFTRIDESTIGTGTRITMSQVFRATIGERVHIGPFANIRPESVVGNESKIGNFVELKKTTLERDVKVSHLTYLGDASVGESTNIGAGTITCNYDGFEKHRTTIGPQAFVGTNSTLVAPVTIGPGAFTAAGSVITEDVPGDALALGRSRQLNKEGWAAEWRRRKKSKTH
ncbi:MAG: bifunctional UDP-N-acetylglucosamine diphosphorylase/glucosamine-1-phosphate N-acetyltransferase GlmU [Fimbriimonas sp.]